MIVSTEERNPEVSESGWFFLRDQFGAISLPA